MFQRKKNLIKQNNRLLLKSGAGGRRRDDDAPLKAHLGKRRLNMSMTHKSIDKRDLRMSLLKRGRNEESEGEESDEKLKEKKGRKSPIMELMEKHVFEGEKVTFSKDHAEIVLHKKHVIPGLKKRQEKTLWSGWEGKVDSSWLERYNNDRADYQVRGEHSEPGSEATSEKGASQDYKLTRRQYLVSEPRLQVHLCANVGSKCRGFSFINSLSFFSFFAVFECTR